MIIVINGRTSEEAAIADFIRNTFLPPRLILLLYLMGPQNPQKSNFPVNFLRNFAIRNVETSHFMIMDMDLWPTLNAYQELRHAANVVGGAESAVILPAFFFNKKRILPSCLTFKQCVLM